MLLDKNSKMTAAGGVVFGFIMRMPIPAWHVSLSEIQGIFRPQGRRGHSSACAVKSGSSSSGSKGKNGSRGYACPGGSH